MTADELVAMVKKANERKKKLESEALAIAHSVVEKALNDLPVAEDENNEEVKDWTREILLKKYHAAKQNN